MGRKRILLTDDQRRVLAVKGKALGRKTMMGLMTIVTPDTILRWHRKLIAEKWNYSDRRKSPPGRPPTSDDNIKLVLKLAKKNPTWGYDRIQGTLANLGLSLSDTTVGNILKTHGIEPAPKRHTTWKTFLQAHWDSIAAVDFTTVDVLDQTGSSDHVHSGRHATENPTDRDRRHYGESEWRMDYPNGWEPDGF